MNFTISNSLFDSSFPRRRESSGFIHHAFRFGTCFARSFFLLDSRLRGITSHLPACLLSGMASSFINDDMMSSLK
jgi:hypothetical protein